MPDPSHLYETAEQLLRAHEPSRLLMPGLTDQLIEPLWKGLLQFDQSYSPKEQTRWSIHIPRDMLFNEPDDGIIRKRRTDGSNDNKIFLHYRPDLLKLLREHDIVPTRSEVEWLTACNYIRKMCFARACSLAQAMDSRLPGFYFFQRLNDFRDLHLLRVLLYDQPVPGQSDIPLAAWHTDRGGFTFNVASSQPGFVARQNGIELPCPEVHLPEVLAFTGDQLAVLTKERIPPLEHAVKSMPGATERRWAIVCFFKVDDGRLGLRHSKAA